MHRSHIGGKAPQILVLGAIAGKRRDWRQTRFKSGETGLGVNTGRFGSRTPVSGTSA